MTSESSASSSSSNYSSKEVVDALIKFLLASQQLSLSGDYNKGGLGGFTDNDWKDKKTDTMVKGRTTDRHTDRQMHRQTDRQTDWPTDKDMVGMLQLDNGNSRN